MGYLSESDYTIRTSLPILDEILTQAALASTLPGGPTPSTDQVRTNAELTAQAEIITYLGTLFQIVGEFNRPSADTNRDRLIIMITVSISLYNLYFTVTPRDIPELIANNYKASIDMLKAFRDGTLSCQVARVPASQTAGARRVEIYSQRKFISKQFDDSLVLNPDVNQNNQGQTTNYPSYP